MKNKIQLVLFILFSVILSSCEKEENNNKTTYIPPSLHGVFVVNEGAFGQGNASVSFSSSDSTYFNPDLYLASNGFPVGDLLQSMTIHNSIAYLCVNNSQKVEVVSMKDFKKIATITGINSPRFFTAKNNTGYISDWGTNKVFSINLLSNTITGSVSCGSGPEEMLISNNKLFVCNGGGFSDDSTVTVIDLNSFTVLDTIHTGVNPSSLCEDKNGDIWILCKGSLGSDFTPTPDDPGGQLLQINNTNYTTIKSISFAFDQHPVRLHKNPSGDVLYFLTGNSTYTGSIYKLLITDNILPNQPFINREFYSLGIHPVSGIIYAGKSSFSANTHFLRYTLNGTNIDSTEVGIGPNSFVFN